MRGIDIWAGLRLISVEDMVREFGVLGLDEDGFLRLCDMLGVTIVHFDNDRYIEYFRFVLRFSAMLSDKKHVWLPKTKLGKTKKVDPVDVSKMDELLRDMAACRAMALKKSVPQMNQELLMAAEKWATAAARARGAKFAPDPGQELELDDPRPD